MHDFTISKPFTDIIFGGAQHNVFTPHPNNETFKKSFRYTGAVKWNSLPAEAKQATTLNSSYSASVY